MNDTNTLRVQRGNVVGRDPGTSRCNPATDPDAYLYDDLLHGDGEEAVRELGTRLKKLVCKKCPDFSPDAEEITLEILERVFERVDTFRHNSRFFSWVGGIAYNVLKERMRQRKKEAMVEGLSETMVSDCLNPEHQVMEETTREINLLLVDEALETLTERQRETFRYKHTTDLTSVEIGEMLGISPGAVRSALADAHASIERWRKKKGY